MILTLRIAVARRLVLSIVLLTVACTTGPSEGVSVNLLVRSDKAVYSLAADHSAQLVLHNRGDRSVFLPMNEYVAVEHLEAGGWGEGIVWFTVDGVGISFRLSPGDSLVGHPMDFRYIDQQPGQYRFVFEVALDSLGHELVPYADLM